MWSKVLIIAIVGGLALFELYTKKNGEAFLTVLCFTVGYIAAGFKNKNGGKNA